MRELQAAASWRHTGALVLRAGAQRDGEAGDVARDKRGATQGVLVEQVIWRRWEGRWACVISVGMGRQGINVRCAAPHTCQLWTDGEARQGAVAAAGRRRLRALPAAAWARFCRRCNLRRFCLSAFRQGCPFSCLLLLLHCRRVLSAARPLPGVLLVFMLVLLHYYVLQGGRRGGGVAAGPGRRIGAPVGTSAA